MLFLYSLLGQELEASGQLNDTIKELYDIGRATNFQVPDAAAAQQPPPPLHPQHMPPHAQYEQRAMMPPQQQQQRIYERGRAFRFTAVAFTLLCLLCVAVGYFAPGPVFGQTSPTSPLSSPPMMLPYASQPQLLPGMAVAQAPMPPMPRSMGRGGPQSPIMPQQQQQQQQQGAAGSTADAGSGDSDRCTMNCAVCCAWCAVV